MFRGETQRSIWTRVVCLQLTHLFLIFALQLWRNFEKKAKCSGTAKEVLKQARWFLSQLKPCITSRTWTDSQISKDWEDQCQRCTGLREGENVSKTLTVHADIIQPELLICHPDEQVKL